MHHELAQFTASRERTAARGASVMLRYDRHIATLGNVAAPLQSLVHYFNVLGALSINYCAVFVGRNAAGPAHVAARVLSM